MINNYTLEPLSHMNSTIYMASMGYNMLITCNIKQVFVLHMRDLCNAKVNLA